MRMNKISQNHYTRMYASILKTLLLEHPRCPVYRQTLMRSLPYN